MTGNKVACTPLFDPGHYGMIIIPEQAKERCDQGIIKYVGPEVEDTHVGDHVLFSVYMGTLLDLEGEGLMIILPEDFIVATVDYHGEEVAATKLPGLYFRDEHGKYFTATYEQALNMVARGLEESKWYQELKGSVHIRPPKIHTQRPTVKDYDKLR